MQEQLTLNYELLYKGFHSPITQLDCGVKCAPYNEKAVPFCCDTRHAVPTAYDSEWDYLQTKTDLWHPWQGEDPGENAKLHEQTPIGQVLLECKGHLHCERPFRTFTCRAFPFFPYINKAGEFIGLSYYCEFEQRCWLINHLEQITPQYLAEFELTYKWIFQVIPAELESFWYHSTMLRRIFGRKHRAISLIRFDGTLYKITPKNGRMRQIRADQLPRFEPYRTAANLPFPDEI
jgi:hypothetical protein